jgi:receptor-binding and translocation channel-forming TcA subunit of Tc toxin
VASQSIVTSGAHADTGLFETNLREERYLPFEGAGAISRWRLELPSEIRQFDYDTISDVILHVRYTARDGGARLKKLAASHALGFIAQVAPVRLFSVRHEFPNEWAKFESGQHLVIEIKPEHYPF